MFKQIEKMLFLFFVFRISFPMTLERERISFTEKKKAQTMSG